MAVCWVLPLFDPPREDAGATIATALQMGVKVKMVTGDALAIAPALKKADCGIAVSDPTDAARAAAAIVLMTPGLSVIIDAIKESWKIFQRMNSYAIYRIAETLRVIVHDPGDFALQLLSVDRGDDRNAGVA
jgi:magnesium-transporting ATPase (P-type)